MRARQPLHLDLNNLFSPNIASGPKNLNDIAGFFADTHKALQVLRQTGQLAFAMLPDDTILQGDVGGLAKKYHSHDNIIVCGIGGSALGVSSLAYALQGPYAFLKKTPRLFVLDNIDPLQMYEFKTITALAKNLFVFISKSGNTPEILAQYRFIKNNFKNLSRKNTVIITDPKQGFLRELAQKEDIPSLSIPPGVGGRFSVFSAAGLFPLALLGVPLEELLAGALHAEAQCRSDVLAQNPAALLATSFYYWLQKKSLQEVVIMPYADRLRFVTDWFAQLFAESLGKRYSLDHKEIHLGFTPIKALGVTDQHSQLQLYLEGPNNKLTLFLEIDHANPQDDFGSKKQGDERIDFLAGKSLADLIVAERQATAETLREQGRPNATIKMAEINAYQLGQLYQVFMNMIPYLGCFWNINAFDQPSVERIKEFTFGLMGRPGFEDLKISQNKKRNALIFS